MTEAAQPSRRVSRERRKGQFLALTGLFLALYCASVAADVALTGVSLLWLNAVLVIATTAAAFGWARMLDEAKITAHYVAWFWGGSLGLTVSGLGVLALAATMMAPGGVEALLPLWAEPNFAFTAGFMLGIVPAAVGYLIWWTVLWARSR
jgi:hypothetical protein